VEDDHDHGQDDQDVEQAAGDVEGEDAEQPQDDQDADDCRCATPRGLDRTRTAL
jgi:hypothetical protein